MTEKALGELRAMPEAELRKRIQERRQELVGIRLKATEGPVEKPHRIRQAKQEIARLFTILREREAQATGTASQP